MDIVVSVPCKRGWRALCRFSDREPRRDQIANFAQFYSFVSSAIQTLGTWRPQVKLLANEISGSLIEDSGDTGLPVST